MSVQAFDAGSIAAEMRLKTTDWERGVRMGKQDMADLTKRAGGVGGAFGGMAKQIAVAAAGIVSFGAAIRGIKSSLSIAMAYESAFAGVRKTVNATEAEFASLADEIRDLGRVMPFSQPELLKLAEAGGQLGIATENLAGFVDTMARLGVSTNISAEDAATSLARWANISGIAQDDLGKLGSAIVELGNNFATTEAEIVDMGMRLVGVGRQVGIVDSDIVAMATVLSSVGLNAEMAGTAMSRLFADTANAVASGGDTLRIFAALTNQTVAEFQEGFRKDAYGAIVQFLGGLNQFSEAGGNAFEVLEELGLSDVRLRDTILRSSTAVDLYRDAHERAAEAIKDTSALTEESNRRFETTESKVDLAKNAFDRLGKALGDHMIPVWRDFLDWTTKATDALTSFVQDDGPLERFLSRYSALLSSSRKQTGLFGLDLPTARPQTEDEMMRGLQDALEKAKAGLPAMSPLPTIPRDMQESASATDGFRESVEAAIGSLGGAGKATRKVRDEVVDLFAEWKLQIESMESFGASMDPFRRGGATLAGLGTVGNVSSQMNQTVAEAELYLQNFTDRAALSFEEVTLLAQDFWRTLSGMGQESMEQVIANIGNPEVKTALGGLKQAAEDAANPTRLEAAADAVGGIGSALGRLPGSFRVASMAAKIASDIMRYAAAAAKGAWGMVELAINAVADALGIMGGKAEEEAKGMAAVIEDIQQASQQWVDRLTDDLLEFVKTGKLAIGDFAQYLADELFRIGISNLVLNPIVETLGDALGFAKGGAFDKGRVIDRPEFFAHKSGLGIRGEAGSEVLLPAVRMADGTMGVRAREGGVSVNVIVNDHRRSGADVQVRRNGQDIEITIEDMVDGALGRLAQTGRLDTLMGGYYGLRRTPA